MRESAVERRSASRTAHSSPRSPKTAPKLEPLEFARWVEARGEEIVDRWLADVRARSPRASEEVVGLLERFFSLLTSMLPVSLGPFRTQVEPLWVQASELFGQVAARRGLAVGEAVEEFQVLREVLIRALYQDPPPSEGASIALRDLLRLNKLVDRGVTFASVGHADALFFALFQGSGVPERLDADLVAEVEEQLASIAAELDGLMQVLGS